MDPSVWLRLSLLQARLRKPVAPAVRALGGVDAFLEAPHEAQIEALGAPPGTRLPWLAPLLNSPVAELLELLEAAGARVLPFTDPAYPAGLNDLPDPPPCLFLLGDASCLLRRTVAIVGSRDAGIYGLETSRAIARGLAEAGVCVVSGLAVGVDASAHRGALDGRGHTAAVLGSGIDDPYPLANRELRAEIVSAGGVILAEPLPGTEPTPREFPRRNRLIAALSLVTVVVGAREGSGALITAGHAAELGREVAAVPGSVRDPFNRGAHQLIRDGAHVVDGPEAVLSLLGWGEDAPRQVALDLEGLTEEQRRVFLALAHQPTHIDALAEELGLGMAQTSAVLMLLVARGLAEPRPGGSYVRGV